MFITINHDADYEDLLATYGLANQEIFDACNHMMRVLLQKDTTPLDDYEKTIVLVVCANRVTGPTQAFTISKVGMEVFNKTESVQQMVKLLLPYTNEAYDALKYTLCATIVDDNVDPLEKLKHAVMLAQA